MRLGQWLGAAFCTALSFNDRRGDGPRAVQGRCEAVQSVVAGDTPRNVRDTDHLLSLVHAGRLRALAVTSRNARR